MRIRLRWKILLFTVPPLLALTFGTLAMVNHSVTEQVQTTVRQDLRRASAVFEDMVAARTRELAVAGMVIVQDPRFFSVLTLPNTGQDVQLRATVTGVADEFNRITGSEVFEVVDTKNRTLGSVGRSTVAKASRAKLVRSALTGHPVTGVLIDANRHYLVSVTPVTAGGRLVGALVLGEGIRRDLALKLRDLTHSEVTFLCGSAVTGTTLGSDVVRATAAAALERPPAAAGRTDAAAHVFEVHAPHETYLTIAAPIPGSDPASGQLYLIQRSLDSETAVLREMQKNLSLLGAVAALLALLAGLLVANMVVAPLRRLVRGAEEMERGNYDYDLRVPSHDEVGYLTARFLDMRKQQRTYVRSLEELARVKSEFISVASHELRTPISIIRCYHELMADQELGPITEAQENALVAIDDSLTRLSRIAENATLMSQIDSRRLVLKRAPHDLASIVAEAIAAATATAGERSVAVSTDIDGALDLAEVDGTQLAHALAQLISNGIRFTPDGGAVRVQATHDDRTDEIVIAVEDSGVGIAPERQARVFERAMTLGDSIHHHSSSTLDFNSAGLGLGLATARGIVEAHGGTITLTSEVGRGSRFEIRVPARDHFLEAAA
ncbi:MAG: HAMP domain-containing sensor histidine kinase [Candidatus Eisenbacteria bacterium]